jgi:RNA polymerase sigma-70 factor, ECF subfamily
MGRAKLPPPYPSRRMSSLERSDRFVELVVDHQRRLYTYILTLLPDPDRACDVLQQTNLVLWRDAERFNEGTNFYAWACRVAYFQVLDHRDRARRDRLRFSQELLEQLTREVDADAAGEPDRLAAMRQCVEKLPVDQRDLLGRRYRESESVSAIAASTGRTDASVANCLYRIRVSLMHCIERRISAEVNS